VSLFPPGSTPWLIGHELRLTFRGQSKNRVRGWVVVGVISLPAVGLGVWLAWVLRHVHIPIVAPAVMVIDVGLALIFTLMLSVTVSRAAQVFFERGDLDLLLSSPVPGRRVLTARCVGMALSASLLFLILVSPFVLASAVFGRPDWLWAYGLIIALSLLATSFGLMVAMGLFSLIGPRATKTLAQVLSAVIGAAFYLLSQASRFMSPRYGGDSSEFATRMQAVMNSGWFSPDGAASWPLRALAGEPVPAISTVAGAILAFLFVTAALGGKFERDAAAAAGVGAGGRKRAKSKTSGFSGGAFQAMLRKELRLLRRDIALISQVLLRVLYLIPTMFFLWRGPFMSGNAQALIPAAAGIVAFLAGQIGSSLGWIVMSGEDGLELLATAPAPARVLRRAKLVAVLVPLSWILVIPVGLIAWQSPQAGVAAAIGSLASGASAGLIAIWYEKPAPRSQFRRRQGGSLVGALADFFISMLWASAAGLAAGDWWMFAAAPVILALVGLAIVQRPQREFVEALQAK
jgi:ABC-2 type transport system permease protein